MVENKIYKQVVDNILKLTNEKLDSDISLIEKQIAKETIKKANLSEDYLLMLLESDSISIMNFSCLKLKELENDDDEIDEEDDYYPDEEDNDEEDEIGLSQTFLIDYIIEYYYLKEKSVNDFDTFLKNRGIPNRKKYIQELQQIYNEAGSVSN